MADPQIAPSPFPGLQDWQRLVATALRGRDPASLAHRTADGILLQPLYPARRDVSPLPGRGGAPWAILQPVDDPDPVAANEQALADIQGGATGLVMRFAGAPLAGGRGIPADREALHLALDGIDVAAIHLRVDPHSTAPATAILIAELIEGSGIAPERARIAFGLDPVSVLASTEGAELDTRSFVESLAALRARGLIGPLAELDGRFVHEAGGTPAQELAAVLASAVWWLREWERAGQSSKAGLRVSGASLSADCDTFLSIAKCRALRLLWARLCEICGEEAVPLPLHVETSRRMITRVEPHTNLIRTTIAAFAAAVGGADSVTVLPFDAALGRSQASARALARNTQLILRYEAGLDRVEDPAAGSGALEAMTEALAEHAWTEFQAIEGEGGIMGSLVTGAFQARIFEARRALRAALADGTAALVGVTAFSEIPDHGSTDILQLNPSQAGVLQSVRLEDLAPRAA